MIRARFVFETKQKVTADVVETKMRKEMARPKGRIDGLE